MESFESIPVREMDFDSIPVASLPDTSTANIPSFEDIAEKKIKPIKYQSFYDKALSSGEGLSAIVPPEITAPYRDMLSDKDYDDIQAMMTNNMYIADASGLSMDMIKYPQLQGQAAERLGLWADAFPEQKKLGQKISERYNNGKIQVQQMDVLYKAAIGEISDDEAILLAEKLESQIKGNPNADFRKLYERMLGGTAEQIPIMTEAVKAAPFGAVMGGTIGLTMALVLGETAGIATPEEVVTIPAFTLKGIKIGGGLAAANRVRQLATGGMYLELLKMKDEQGNKIDPRIAKVIVHIIGTINGAVELAEWAIVLETFGIGTKVFENAASKVSTKLFVEGSLKEIATKYMLKYGTVLAAETTQEMVQETSNIIGGELAKEIMNQYKGGHFTPATGEEIKQRLTQTMIQSAESFALIVAPGTIISGTSEAIRAKPITEPIKPVAKPKPEYVKTDIKDTIQVADEKVEISLDKKEEVSETKTAEIVAAPADVEDLTTQEQADIAQLDVEIEKENLYEMKRVNIGTAEKPVDNFIIYEKATGKEVAVINKRKPATEKLNDLNKLAEPVKETKRKPALLKTPIGKLVDEYSALRAGLKKAAKDARNAFSIGEAEGIAKVKAYYKELKQKMAEKEELQARIDKAIKVIKKPFESKNIDFFYREVIEKIQRGIDPKRRSKNTILERQATKEFLKRATPEQLKDFPVKLLELLSKKTLNDMTIEELEDTANQIKTLEKLGKTKQKAKLAIAETGRKKNVNDLISTTKTTDKTVQDEIGSIKTKEWESNWKQKGLALISWAWRMPRILDFLDGAKGTFKGIWHTLLYDNVNDAYNEELRMIDIRKSKLNTAQQKLDISDNELVQPIDFSEVQNGLSLTVEQMMGIYAGIKNQLSLDAIINGCKISPEAIKIILSNLDQKYKDFADAIISEYQENYSRLREAFIEDKGEDLGSEQFYTPMVRTERTGLAINEQLVDELLARFGLKKGYVEKGFTINRKQISAEHQKPIDLRLVAVGRSQLQKQEHYINFAAPLKKINSLISDEKIRTVLKLKGGPDLIKTFENYSSRIANPSFYKSFDSIERWSKLFRRHIAVAYLAYNLVTISRQAGALILTLKDANPAHIISATYDFIQHPIETSVFVMNLDPQIKHRFIEREMTELQLKELETSAYEKIIGTVGRTGMIGISAVDFVTRVISWKAIYEQSIQSGMSQEEAIRNAQLSILRTQEAGSPKDLARLYATNEYLNWFTMFTQQINQLFNIVSYDIFAYWNNKNYQKTAYTVIALALNASLMWAITNKRLPEDEDDVKDIIAEEVLSWVPLAGNYLSSGYQGFGAEAPAPAQLPLAAGRALSAKDKEKAALKLLEETSALAGYPVVAHKRLYRTIDQEDLTKLFGEKPKKKSKFKLP